MELFGRRGIRRHVKSVSDFPFFSSRRHYIVDTSRWVYGSVSHISVCRAVKTGFADPNTWCTATDKNSITIRQRSVTP